MKTGKYTKSFNIAAMSDIPLEYLMLVYRKRLSLRRIKTIYKYYRF